MSRNFGIHNQRRMLNEFWNGVTPDNDNSREHRWPAVAIVAAVLIMFWIGIFVA